MDFVAIDFETATSKPTSVCSLGICVVKDNKITLNKEFLIKPVPFEFNDYNIYIHGITPERVAGCMTFNYLWDSLKPYIDNNLVVAHNAAFDVGALRHTLDMFNIEYPTFDYLCTVKLAQLAYPELPSHKLNTLSDALGIHLNHHQAMDDSFACASILLRIMEDYNLESICDIEECFEIGIGKLYPGCYEPCTKRKNIRKRKT